MALFFNHIAFEIILMFDFIKIGEVPKTSWSSEDTFNLKPRLKTLMALALSG